MAVGGLAGRGSQAGFHRLGSRGLELRGGRGSARDAQRARLVVREVHRARGAERVQLQRAPPRDVDVDAAGAQKGDGRSCCFKCTHHFFVAEFDCSASATLAADVVRGSREHKSAVRVQLGVERCTLLGRNTVRYEIACRLPGCTRTVPHAA